VFSAELQSVIHFPEAKGACFAVCIWDEQVPFIIFLIFDFFFDFFDFFFFLFQRCLNPVARF
jgi:hypothetical protein